MATLVAKGSTAASTRGIAGEEGDRGRQGGGCKYLPAGFDIEVETPGDLPRSGGLVSPLFSNMALRFLTWLMVMSPRAKMRSGCPWSLAERRTAVHGS